MNILIDLVGKKPLHVLLCLVVGLTGQAAAEVVCWAPLPAEDWTVLAQCELEEGEDYDVALVATEVPADEHEWQAAVTVALREADGGEVYAVASGGPKRYLERHTDGNGRTYWSHLLIATISGARGGLYDLALADSTVSDPFPGVLHVVVTESLPNGAGLEADETGWFWWTVWEVIKSQGFVLTLIFVALLSGLAEAFSSDSPSERKKKNESTIWGVGCGGGGCGGGCGGCGGCGG